MKKFHAYILYGQSKMFPRTTPGSSDSWTGYSGARLDRSRRSWGEGPSLRFLVSPVHRTNSVGRPFIVPTVNLDPSTGSPICDSGMGDEGSVVRVSSPVQKLLETRLRTGSDRVGGGPSHQFPSHTGPSVFGPQHGSETGPGGHTKTPQYSGETRR